MKGVPNLDTYGILREAILENDYLKLESYCFTDVNWTIDNVDDLGIDFKVIGEVNNSNKIQITLSNGEVKEIENRGYNHYVS